MGMRGGRICRIGSGGGVLFRVVGVESVLVGREHTLDHSCWNVLIIISVSRARSDHCMRVF